MEEELKSRNMKTELITNVSHDLKTPLTAIITYVNLLKEEGTTEEERKSYIEILDRKSLRLKKLIGRSSSRSARRRAETSRSDGSRLILPRW